MQDCTLKVTAAEIHRYSEDIKSSQDIETIVKVNLSGLRSQFNNMAVTEQYTTENMIAKDLNDKYDIKLQRGIELIDFQDKGSYVEVKLAPYRGKLNQSDQEESKVNVEILRVQYLLGCDGAHSFVRYKLDLPFDGEKYDQRFILFHGSLNNDASLPWPTGMIINGVRGILFIISLADHTWYLIGDLDEKQQEEINKRHQGQMKQPTEDDINWMLQQRGLNGITVKQTKWLSAFTIESKQITQYSKGIII